MMTATDTRKEARNHLKNKWGKGVLITLCYFIIEMIISFILNKTENMDIIGTIVSIAQFLISVPLSYGIIISFMKLKRDEEVSAFDFITSGFSSFGRAWKIYLRIILKMILPIVLVIISFVIITVAMLTGTNGILTRAQEASESNNYYYNLEQDTISMTQSSSSDISTLMIAGVVLLFASGIYSYTVSLKYVLSYFIAYDETDLSSKEVVEKSAKMMNKNRGNYFVLTLSFIGWALLALLTLGIGYLWLVPYMQVSQICFYEALKEKDETPIEQ